MKPPKDPDASERAASDTPLAVSLRLVVMSKRADFQRAARGPKVAMPGFILQMRTHAPNETTGPRVGFTCSKKVGNSVARNRAKRRLREVARLGLHGVRNADFVLIGRQDATASLPFAQLQRDLRNALQKLNALKP
jgi:ribonuclease P protein component